MTVGDPAEAICDAIVTFLNNYQTSTPFAFRFTAEKPDDPQAELEREQADLKVFVGPFGEDEERLDRGAGALIHPQINLLVTSRIDSRHTRSQLNGLAWSIRCALRGQAMAGWRWSSTETVIKSSPDEISQSRNYANVTRINYVGTNKF